HRAQKVIMQTAVDELTPKQVHEDPCRSKEHERSQDHGVVNDRVGDAVLIKVSPLAPGRCNERGGYKSKQWGQRQQINQYRTATEKVFLELHTKDRADLAEPQCPVEWR